MNCLRMFDSVQHSEIGPEFVRRQGPCTGASAGDEPSRSRMGRVCDHHTAHQGIVENTLQEIAELCGGGLEAIVPLAKHQSLNVLSRDLADRPVAERGVDFLLQVAAELGWRPSGPFAITSAK